ncbi:hypothetical protein M153_1963000349 [Pseudoloma neurophilia]|uniref:Uncharacterized protein n=1 Tax=Pseudoloma neurophilia TaxID=146866 RepID=A0A0R0LUI7_9MICR|nr:hypothetical protein M153_1963000349 [Pseudoloma neurophilia]
MSLHQNPTRHRFMTIKQSNMGRWNIGTFISSVFISKSLGLLV